MNWDFMLYESPFDVLARDVRHKCPDLVNKLLFPSFLAVNSMLSRKILNCRERGG